MNDHDHVVLASLAHDIGKFWERAGLLDQYRQRDEDKQPDCPWNPQGYFSHLHVLNTRAFCERLAAQWPIAPVPGSDQNWINLACRHHKTSTPLERLVAEADHFASAEREEGNFYQYDIHRKTRLEPILGRIQLGAGERTNLQRMPLASLALDRTSLFPQPAGRMDPPMRESQGVWLATDSLQPDYRRLGEAFRQALDELPQYATATPDSLRGMVRGLLALMERFLVGVPAATNITHPDISLFDHLRVTAAIAEGLYLYHAHEGTLDRPDAFKDTDTAKWRLACGDFSGIQNFIYKITSKGAARALRGRSFYIQLLCDGVADDLLRRLGLYPTARIYASGGKFFLLIPAHLEVALRASVADVNAALLKEFQGDVYLGLGVAEVRGRDFKGGHMGACWKAASENLHADRLRAFHPAMSAGSDFFAPQGLHAGHCAVCGRDDAEAHIRERDDRAVCRQCDTLERLGRRLKDTRYLFWVHGKDREAVRQDLAGEERIDLPGTAFSVYLLAELPRVSPLRPLHGSHLEAMNAPEAAAGNPNGYSVGFRHAGLWDTGKPSGDWEFDDFAQTARGIQKLGILRMDVDNLGEIFVRGLTFGSRYMGSLSRVATLSRQLHLFFAGYLNTLLAEFPRTQVIYAGGDDVFLIGGWDELPEVADRIRSEFRAWCADNPNFTLSGGIALVDGRYPLSRAAQLAGEAEHQAKALRRGRANRDKDALCLLDTPIGWEDYPRAVALREEIIAINEATNSRALLGRLRSVILAVEEHRRLDAQEAPPLEELVYWRKWRWRLVYNLERMARRHPAVNSRLQALQGMITEQNPHEGQPVLDWLQLPTRWAEFLTRRNT